MIAATAPASRPSVNEPDGGPYDLRFDQQFVGPCVNRGSELLRDCWKAFPENKVALHGPLLRYATRINCSGDILCVGGLAMLAENRWSAATLVLLFCFFALLNAPLFNTHLAENCADEFVAHTARIKRIVLSMYRGACMGRVAPTNALGRVRAKEKYDE